MAHIDDHMSSSKLSSRPFTAQFQWLPGFALLVIGYLCMSPSSAAAQQSIYDAPGFSVEPKALLQASSLVPVQRDASVAILFESEHEIVDEMGREKRVSRTIYRIDAIEGVKEWGATRWYYSPWFQSRPQIRARVITPDGVQHDLDSKTLIDNVVRDDSPEVYSDDHVFEGPLPAVTIGAIVEEEAVIRDTAPFFEGAWSRHFVIGHRVPVQMTRFVVDVPKFLSVHYTTPQLPGLKTQRTEVDGMVRYTFEHDRIEPEDLDDFLPPDVPWRPTVSITTAPSWQSIATQYWTRTEPLIRPAEVRQLVAGIKADDPNAVATILAKVHANVRYTGLEFGESSIIPQPPSVVLQRKYGDCKEKSTLLISMLRAIGIRANLVLLNSGFGSDINPGTPGARQFNHAIVYLPEKDLFIDATAEYFRVGEMPSANQNRWALIISNDTTELKRIPQLPSSTNRIVEKREFLLSEYGPAKVIETTQAYGNREASYRSTYEGSESKTLKKDLDSYAESMYLADGVAKYEYSKAEDLAKPFTLRLEINKAKRASTGLFDAVAAIRLIDMVSDQVPDVLAKEDDEKKSDDDGANKKKPRTADWYFNEIYQAEWQYRIVPPNGAFRPRVLPENKTVKFGPALYTQEFRTTPDGVVEATLRFDLQKRRFTIAEANELREALKQMGKNGVLYIYFDLLANTLLQQGKVREGLAEFRKLESTHPKEGLHRAQIARAYLASGLGELAREEAQQAVKLDPTSAVCHATLGWVLQHDLFGRQFENGFDPVGAAAAFKKASELDPEDVDYPFSRAISLEYDSDGERYLSKTRLEEAIHVYRELRKNKDADADAVTGNLAYALAYANRFSELRELLSELGSTPLYDSMRVLSTAVLETPGAALKYADQITNNEKKRSDALANAGTLAMRMRLYPQAHELLAAGASGQPNASQMTNLAQILGRTVKHEEKNWSNPSPATLVLKMFVHSANPAGYGELPKMLSRASHELPEEAVQKITKPWRFRFTGDLPQLVLLDLTFGMVKTTSEGDDTTGYRVSLQIPGAKTQHVFVVKESGEYKILSETEQFAPLGQEVLDRIARNDLAGAKVLLDWAREDRQLSGGEDPYVGHTFARVWNRNQPAEASAMRLAAASLVTSIKDAGRPHIADIEAMLKQATTDSDRNRIEEVLMVAYATSGEWQKAADVNARLLERNPSSVMLLRRIVGSLVQIRKSKEALGFVDQYKDKVSDPEVAARLRASIYLSGNQSVEAMTELKALIDNGKGNQGDVNNYGWAAVMNGNVSDDVLEAVQQTTMTPQNREYGILHTLAAMYAMAGRLPQARQTLLDALKSSKDVDGPESSIWYVAGLLAESYGEPDAAVKLYQKVQKPEIESESSTYNLSQKRVHALKAAASAPKRAS